MPLPRRLSRAATQWKPTCLSILGLRARGRLPGSNHAAMLLEHLRETEETLVASADLQTAFLDDLAEHIATSAEVDEEAQLRISVNATRRGLVPMRAGREPRN